MEVGNGAPAGPASESPSVETVFRDWEGRRVGVLKALTTDVEEFFQQCDPEKDNLCLYGYPDERWEVTLPIEEVPAELPEPIVGINFSRDAFPKKDWIDLVAVHSDTWLLAVAFYFGARFGFDKADRKHLFNLINSLPTIYEVVTGSAKKQSKKKPSASSHNSNKSKPGSKACQSKLGKYSKPAKEDKGLDEKDEDQGGECAKCGKTYITTSSMFWIGCDTCDKWYHGKCVKVSPAMAEHMPNYQCPACSIDMSSSKFEVMAVLRFT